jgi:regulatory protein
MKVEGLKSNNKSSYTVTFSDDHLNTHDYVVSEDLVVNHRLIKGKVLDETAFRIFKADFAIDSIFQKTKSLLIRYPKTVHETILYLEDKTSSSSELKQIIQKLIQSHLLDDEQYALHYYEKSFHLFLNGPTKVVFELKQKGIDDHLIEALMPKMNEYHIQQNLNRLFDKKLPSLLKKPKQKAMLLMKQYFYQKGYALEDCEAFVSKRAHLFSNEEAEFTMLEKDYLKASKKYADSSLSDYDKKSKIITSLMAKGYRYDTIKKYLVGR